MRRLGWGWCGFAIGKGSGRRGSRRIGAAAIFGWGLCREVSSRRCGSCVTLRRGTRCAIFRAGRIL